MNKYTKEQLSVVLGCVIHDKKVLLIRRNEPKILELHNYFEFPGGKIDFGENPSTAIEREIIEETGNIVNAKDLLPFSYVAIRKKEKQILNVIVWCYLCDFIEEISEYTQPKKISECIWVPIYKLDPIKIQSGTLQFLLHVIQQQNLSPDKKIVLGSNEYLTLQSIEIDQNRKRIYDILIEARIDQLSTFKIQCQWGRLGENGFRKCKIEEFVDRDKALKYINDVLITRYQHKYKIITISENFPRLPILSNFTRENSIPFSTQLRLF